MKSGTIGGLLLLLAGCAGGIADEGGGGSSKAADVALGEVVERSQAIDPTGVVWRGPMRWRAPGHWSEVDSSGRPFIVAEYQLPGHAEDQPSHCVISSGQKPGTDAQLERQLARESRRVGVKTAEGKSLGDRITTATRSLGTFEWSLSAAEGHLYDDGTILDRRDPPLIVPDYAGRTATPKIPGPPFSIRCVAPSDTLKAESAAIDAWLATIEVDPIPTT